MRPHRYSEAERSFRRALMTTEPLPPHDARIRASLGNLVRVAAAYHRAGRTEEAEHLMVLVRNHVQQQRTASRRAVRYDELDRSFIELIRVRARMIRRPTLRESSESPVHYGFDPLIRENARRFGLDPALVKAVVAAESNFEVAAVSHAGAQGLMQLMPATAREMGVKAPFDPRENLMGGSRYLRDMLDRYDDVKLALAAYNAGPTAVDRYDGVPPYPETTAYVNRVLRYFEDYRQQSP
jgi:soluble lytic murein transglycosylase-like protein